MQILNETAKIWGKKVCINATIANFYPYENFFSFLIKLTCHQNTYPLDSLIGWRLLPFVEELHK